MLCHDPCVRVVSCTPRTSADGTRSPDPNHVTRHLSRTYVRCGIEAKSKKMYLGPHIIFFCRRAGQSRVTLSPSGSAAIRGAQTWRVHMRVQPQRGSEHIAAAALPRLAPLVEAYARRIVPAERL